MSKWYGHPRVLGIPIPKTLVIWAFPVTLILTLTQTQIAKVIWEGDVHITRVLGMGMPKTRGCPYHCDTGLLPQKGKRDLNGEQSCTVTVIKEVYSSKCCPATFHLSTWLAWNLPLSRWNYLKHINNFCTTVVRVLTTFQNTPNFLQFGLKCRKDNFNFFFLSTTFTPSAYKLQLHFENKLTKETTRPSPNFLTGIWLQR